MGKGAKERVNEKGDKSSIRNWIGTLPISIKKASALEALYF
jgi:hypothetical protein